MTGTAGVLRLTFSYSGDDVRLVSTQAVKMKAPPADPLTWEENTSGFWVVLRDANRRVLYRRIVHDAIRTSTEVFTQDRKRPFERHDIASPQGVFVVLVPDLPAANNVALFGSARTSEKSRALTAARELASFDLTQRGGRS